MVAPALERREKSPHELARLVPRDAFLQGQMRSAVFDHLVHRHVGSEAAVVVTIAAIIRAKINLTIGIVIVL